jgi:hypothetical protein
MFDQAYLDALAAGYQPTAPTQKKHGNFFQSLIPAAGGTAGAVGGAAIGTALLPGIGTIAGGLIGGALGGGAGKVGENALEHKGLGSGVLGEAALNGVFGAGPLRLGKVGIDAVRGVKAGTGLAEALTKAGSNAANMSITGAVGKKLSNSGTNLIAKEFRLTPSQQFNFNKLHGEQATQVLRRFGIKSPEDIAAKIQPLQDSFNAVVHQVPAISKNELSAGLQKVYGPLLKSPALFEQGLGQQIKSQADELLKQAKGGSLSADAVNQLRQTFDAAVKYTQHGAPEYNVIKKTADALRGTLQSAADKAGVKVNGQTFREIGRDLNKLHGLDDVVGKQAFNGTGSLPLSLPNLLGAGIGTGAAGGPAGALGGFLAAQTINSPVGRRVIANGTIKAGENMINKGASNAAGAFGPSGIAKRVLPVGVAGAAAGQLSEGNNSANTNMAPTSTNAPMNANMPGQYQNGTNLSSDQYGGMFSKDNELAAIISDIQATGGKNIKTIQTVFELAQPQQTKLNSTQQQQANNSVSGLQDLQTIASMIQQDPSVLIKDAIPGGAIARNLTGTGNYDAAKQNIVDVISRLRSGAAITADEAKRYMGLLPKAGDSQETALSKIQRLNDLLQGFANPQPASNDLSTVLAGLS